MEAKFGDKTMSITIKPLPDEDAVIKTVASWLDDEWGNSACHLNINRFIRILQKSIHSKGIPLTLIAYHNSIPVGTASLQHDDMETRKNLWPWLACVYVKQNFRNKGIGSLLCNRIHELAVCMGLSKIYLFTPDMESFYIKLNWKTIERTRYRDREVMVMEKDLRTIPHV